MLCLLRNQASYLSKKYSALPVCWLGGWGLDHLSSKPVYIKLQNNSLSNQRLTVCLSASKCNKCQTWQHEQEVERSCLLLHPQTRVSNLAVGEGGLYTVKVHPLCHTSSNSTTNWKLRVQMPEPIASIIPLNTSTTTMKLLFILYNAWVVLSYLQRYKSKEHCSFSSDIMNQFPSHQWPVNYFSSGFRNCLGKRRSDIHTIMLSLALWIY